MPVFRLLFSALAVIVGIVMFFARDRRTLSDVVTKTRVVYRSART